MLTSLVEILHYHLSIKNQNYTDMKNIFTTLVTISTVVASSYAAEFPSEITENTTGYLAQYGNYTISDDVTLTHTNNGARHYEGTITLAGSADNPIEAVLNIDEDTLSSTSYFGINGATFKGYNKNDVLTITNTGDSASYVMSGGLTVDNVTVKITNIAANAGSSVVVKNNGVLEWTNGTNNYSYNLTIGSVDANGIPITSDKSHLKFTNPGGSWMSGTLNVYNGSFDLSYGTGRFDLSNSTIYNLSADSKIGYVLIKANEKFTIASGIKNTISFSNTNLVFMDNATFEINSSNITKNGSNPIGLHLANSASTGNLIVGADNTFAKIGNDETKGQSAYTWNILLNNGAELTADTVNFVKATLDFDEDSYGEFTFKLASVEGNTIENALTKILLGGNQVEWDYTTSGDYYTISFVPEPSTYAMLFGAIALAFVAYRRRK